MSTEILMPALSPTMTEGKIARWVKSEGDHVAPGDVLAEIETDKATMEVEAVDEGILARIVIPEGTEHVAVNTPIAVITANGEEVSAAPAKTPAPRETKPPETHSETPSHPEPSHSPMVRSPEPPVPAPPPTPAPAGEPHYSAATAT